MARLQTIFSTRTLLQIITILSATVIMKWMEMNGGVVWPNFPE